MRSVLVRSIKNHKSLADKCIVAESFFSRLKGLIGTTSMEAGQGLLLRPCNDIHMWFMSIPIDVIFAKEISKEDGTSSLLVSSVRRNLRPWKFLPVRDGKASVTLELPVGTIDRCDIREGDELCIS